MNSLDSFEILVIILSLTLAAFLVLGIILMIYLLRIVKRVNEISEKANKIVNNIEAVSKVATHKGPVSLITRIVSSIIESLKKSEGKGE